MRRARPRSGRENWLSSRGQETDSVLAECMSITALIMAITLLLEHSSLLLAEGDGGNPGKSAVSAWVPSYSCMPLSIPNDVCMVFAFNIGEATTLLRFGAAKRSAFIFICTKLVCDLDITYLCCRGHLNKIQLSFSSVRFHTYALTLTTQNRSMP